ncbi:Guanine nucleotide-binding-like protein 1 [Mactra antiquata]
MPRKKPFSSKQKKKQLQEKRIRKQESGPSYLQQFDSNDDSNDDEGSKIVSDKDMSQDNLHQVKRVNQQPAASSCGKYDPNRYRLHFQQESKEKLARRKERTRHPYTSISEEDKEMDVTFDLIYDIPKRPPWDYSLSKIQLENSEEKYFKKYLDDLFTSSNMEELSYIELNLETWRQLWRVLEMSDIFLVITDIRHPAMHFPPALYKYITEELNKSVIIVLNKVDLAPPPLVVAWQQYFQENFPLVDVVCFSSFPKSSEEIEQQSRNALHGRRKRGTFRALGPLELLSVCQKIVESKVDLSSWKEKIDIDQGLLVDDSDDDDDDDNDKNNRVGNVINVKPDVSFQQHEKYKDGILTIGCVGYPNVGKSSLINGLMGKKLRQVDFCILTVVYFYMVVSVSRSPGHTKHFQTIFLTPTVKLCDSPGLVFPSKIDRNLQILGGIYPIAQVRDPFSTVEYIAKRLDLPHMLKLKPVDEDEDVSTFQWSAMDICEAWAEKRGFLTAKAARLDAYRAANNILRLALDGRICLCLYPKGYVAKQEYWTVHKDTEMFIGLQNSYRQKLQACADSDHGVNQTSSDPDEGDSDSQSEMEVDNNKSVATSNPFALLSDDT